MQDEQDPRGPAGLRRVVAPNPGPLTGAGTNSWIVGRGAVAVIDPGPADPAHLAAILAALAPGERVAAVIVTHAHRDHSPLARPLADRFGAPVHAFGRAREGARSEMAALTRGLDLGGGEGIDETFAPDIPLRDGEAVQGPDWRITAIHTPGHLPGHLCLAWDGWLFSGDHAMGWATSLVSPPEGDMGAYVDSLERLAAQAWHGLLPGHGAAVARAADRLAELIAHRRAREAQILSALAAGPASPRELTARIYADTPVALHPAACRNVLAHLLDLTLKNRVAPQAAPGPDTVFRRL
ncbi:MAG: MBL fold metallo-hydrolase [Rhodobacterales bacterium]|nr:MBL fold metallo-hydrolase [Rhodobacterales bacterium]